MNFIRLFFKALPIEEKKEEEFIDEFEIIERIIENKIELKDTGKEVEKEVEKEKNIEKNLEKDVEKENENPIRDILEIFPRIKNPKNFTIVNENINKRIQEIIKEKTKKDKMIQKKRLLKELNKLA
jgi:hypothetical protein